MPDRETEEDAFTVRLRGAKAAAGYRHAVACVNGEIERAELVRVAVRDVMTPGAPIQLFELRLDGNETVATLIEGSSACSS
ncbi:MAG TPA: hypothetical protein PLS69_02590 [Terricaulis sp.]|nr:hypothetical protein [Terricaulis sp.]